MSVTLRRNSFDSQLDLGRQGQIKMPEGHFTKRPEVDQLEEAQKASLLAQWEMQEDAAKIGFVTNMMQMSFQTIMSVIRNIRGA